MRKSGAGRAPRGPQPCSTPTWTRVAQVVAAMALLAFWAFTASAGMVSAPGLTAATAAAAPVIDGRIAEGEYASHYVARGIGRELHWTIEGDSIYIGLRAPTTGWLAIGWDPSGPIMEGEDILIGYIRGRGLFLPDYYTNRAA